jgi:O-antigen/teichoic acid export membrane protein
MLKLLKAMAAMASASLLSQVLGIFTNKILAIIMGPAGVGMFGLYRQLVDIAGSLACIGSSGGLVQALSSTEGEARLRRLAAAMWLNVMAIIVTVLVMIFLAPMIAREYFVRQDPAIEWAARWLSVPIALIMLGSLASNLISASRAFRLLGIVMVAPAAGSLIFSYPLAKAAAQGNQWGYVGLLIVPAALQVLLALPIVRQLGWLREIGASFQVRPRRDDILHYVRFHATTLLATFIGFITFLVLPPLLIVNYGADANGFFRAAWSIGMQNLAIMLSSFSAYVVPVLSGAGTEEERSKVLNDAAFVIVLLSVPLIGGLIIFQPLVIRILYNEQFLPSIEMLHWLLLANYFRVAQWLFLLVSMTRAQLGIFTVTGVGFNLGFLVIGWLAVGFPPDAGPIAWLSGIRGLGFAFFVSYVAVTIVTAVLTWRRYRYFTERRTSLVWLVGLVVVVLCDVMTWNDLSMNWPQAVALSLLCCATPALLFDAQRRAQLRGMVAAIRGRRTGNGAPD